MININIQFNHLLFKPQGRVIMQQEFKRAMFETVTFGESTVAKNTPVGATGILRQSITGVVKSAFKGEIRTAGPSSKYADVTEKGRRPGKFPPPDAIELYLKRSTKGKAFVDSVASRFNLSPARALKSATFLKSRGIARFGTPAAEMFKKSIPLIQKKALFFYRKATDRIARRLN